MNIVYIITSWDFGGAEFQVLALAEYLQTNGHQITVVSMIDPNKNFLAKSNAKGIRFFSLGMKKGQADIRAIQKFKRIISKVQPQVIHAHMIHAVLLARVCNILSKRFPKIVSTAHSINEGGFIRETLYRLTDFASDLNTNVSEIGTKSYIEKKIFSSKKTLFVPNGITQPPKNKIEYRNTSPFKFICVGRLVPAKDYSTLLQAVKLLKNETSLQFQVQIAGTGYLQNEIQKLIEELDLSEELNLLGHCDNIQELLLNADSFLMSSAWEGLPIALLEAASVGLPLLATNVGGCSEVVNVNNGFIVPPKKPEALAAVMLQIMKLSPEKRADMGRWSLSKIQDEYLLDVVAKKWIELYEKIDKGI